MEKFYPVLCGGTFLTLLLRARKQRKKARDILKTGADKLNDRYVFLDLIKTVKSNYEEPEGFGKITSEYKSCKKQSHEHLSFLIDYGSQLEARYPDSLDRMVSFIKKYLDVDQNGGLHDRLVRELLDLIEQDRDIDNEAEFRLLPNGFPARKADLLGSLDEPLDICLPVFLLSIWHFIIKNRPDTAVGKSTYERWHTTQNPGEKARREYVGIIGKDYQRPLNIEVSIGSCIRVPVPLEPHGSKPPNHTSALAEMMIPPDSQIRRGFVVDVSSVENNDGDDEIKALLNGQPTQATKDYMSEIVDAEILPWMREKLREPMLRIYDLIINQAEGIDEDASSEMRNFIQLIDSEVLHGSTASLMIHLSEHRIYDSLLRLREFVENHNRYTSLSVFGNNCCEPSYYTRLQKEFEALVMVIFSEDGDA